MAILRIIDTVNGIDIEYQSEVIPRIDERITLDDTDWYFVKRVIHVIRRDWSASKNANVLLYCDKTN